jgi:hypothetical protein
MTKYDFALILSDSGELTEETAETLFAAGCDDGTPGSCDGVLSIDFHRVAESLEHVIRSAIADVRSAGFRVARVMIEADAVAK